jgi:2-polyprenyl-3-methyl-5-hydroxy-6-metoxy-1,4-benzoquinol methylase
VDRVEELRQAWDERARVLGLTKRAVLFKRFPGWLNESVHRRHAVFALRNVPEQASRVLDVGCGFGRMSEALRSRRPDLSFQGVDLCADFAEAYSASIGPCFLGAVQDFEPNERVDVVLLVTLLMYLDPEEQESTVRRCAVFLNPGGRIICIEPAIETVLLFRRLTGRQSASPTGGSVHYFTRDELASRFEALGHAVTHEASSMGFLPGIPVPALYHGLAIGAAAGEG